MPERAASSAGFGPNGRKSRRGCDVSLTGDAGDAGALGTLLARTVTAKQVSRPGTAGRRRRGGGAAATATPSRPRANAVRLGWWGQPLVALEAGLLAIAVAVPLALYRGVSDTFELPKQITFRVLLVATLYAAAALAAVRLARARPDTTVGHALAAGGQRMRRLDVLLPLIGVLLVLVVWLAATVNSLAPTISWWGVPSRWGGTRTQIAYLALFLTAMGAIRRPVQVARLAGITAVVATAIAAYALIQRAGLDPLRWTANITELTRADMPAVAVRPSSTFGNPNFLGAYLTISTLLTAGRLLEARQGQPWWTAALAVQALALLLTQSRTAWIAAACGLVALALWTMARRRGPWKRTLLGLAAAGAAAAVGLWALAPVLPSGSLLARAASIVRPTEGTGGIRLVLWRMTWRTWQDRPLLGFGPDLYVSVYERHYDLALQQLEGGYTEHNRAENAVLDTLISTGALGAVAMGALGLAVARAAWRALSPPAGAAGPTPRRRGWALLPPVQGAVPAALIAALGAYLITAQTNPEVIGASFLAWLCAGCIAGLALGAASPLDPAVKQAAGGAAQSTRSRVAGGTPWGALAALGMAGLVLTGLYAWTLELPTLMARRSFDLGLQAAREDRTPEYASLIEQAAHTWRYEPRYWAELAFAHLAVADTRTPAARPAEYTAALNAIDHALAINPVSPIYKAYLGEIASRISVATNDAALAARARAAHEESVSLGPNSWEYWQRWGQTEYRLKNYAAAREEDERSVQLFDKYWVVWTNLGDAAAQSGDRARARQAWQHALEICQESPRPCTDAERDQVQRAINSLGPAS